MLEAFIAVALAAAAPAVAQSGTTYQQPPQAGQPAAQQPPAQPQPPAQQPPPAQEPPPESGATASPGTGAASQQVVVNPPPAQAGTAQQQPPPPPTTVVTPPPPRQDEGDVDVVVERREERNPMATVATDAAYGGIAGLLVGVGVALVNEWDDWDRDIMIGAGAGLLVGAAVGVAHAAYDARENRRRDRVAFDGLGSTDRDPVITGRTVLGFSGRF